MADTSLYHSALGLILAWIGMLLFAAGLGWCLWRALTQAVADAALPRTPDVAAFEARRWRHRMMEHWAGWYPGGAHDPWAPRDHTPRTGA